MAKVADYAIVADNWVLEKDKNIVNFEVPANIDKGSRCILGFMINTNHLDDMKLVIRLNGTNVWNWSLPGHVDEPARFFQEVVAAGVVVPGTNEFKFTSSSDDATVVEVSDVVVWFQANI